MTIANKIIALQGALYESNLRCEGYYEVSVAFSRDGRSSWSAYLVVNNDETRQPEYVSFNVNGTIVVPEFQAETPELALEGLHQSILRLSEQVDAQFDRDWAEHLHYTSHTD